MKTITFTCQTISPMFLSGADGKTPELRPPSLKGVMRFWWRAIHGHLSLKDLKEKEGKIFGDTSKRSQVILRCQSSPLATETNLPVPHKDFMKQRSYAVGQVFSVTLGLTRETKDFDLNKLSAVFELACMLGGLGKRARRGMGSVQMIDYEKQGEGKTPYPKVSPELIASKLQLFSPYFDLRNGEIYQTYQGRMELYPWIKSIKLGEEQGDVNKLLLKISNTTHVVKEQDPRTYEASLGHAFRGRFASPVFVSVIANNPTVQPIITTLNAVPDRGKGRPNPRLQEEFSQRILKK